MGEMTSVGDLPAYRAVPAGEGPWPGLVVVHEAFGLDDEMRAHADRLAAMGFVALVPDLFARGRATVCLARTLAALRKGQGQAFDDIDATRSALLADPACHGAAGVIGFCLGGTLAWAVAVNASPSVCVSYYGSGVPAMIGDIDKVTCPTLFHFGDKDAYIPNDGVEQVNAAIAGRPGFVLNVEHAGHAFDNHESEMFHDEAAARAAWAKTMAFLGEHLPT